MSEASEEIDKLIAWLQGRRTSDIRTTMSMLDRKLKKLYIKYPHAAPDWYV